MTIVVRPSNSRSSEPWTSRSRLGVERRGRLVEQQQRRVAQQGAGDGDALALAAREARAALAEIGVEPLRQPAQEFGGIGRLGRLPELARRSPPSRP